MHHGKVWATSIEKQSVMLDEGFSNQSQPQFPNGHVRGISSWDVTVVGQAQWGGNKSSNYHVEQVFCCCVHPTIKCSKEARLRMKFPLKCLCIPPSYLEQWERCLPLSTGGHKTWQEKQWLLQTPKLDREFSPPGPKSTANCGHRISKERGSLEWGDMQCSSWGLSQNCVRSLKAFENLVTH